MNTILSNRLKKKTPGCYALYAQVQIFEHQNHWRVAWTEADGTPDEQKHIWYDGDDWGEMLRQFRMQLRLRVQEGYVPIIPMSTWPQRESSSKKHDHLSKLTYYAHLHPNDTALEAVRTWRKEQAFAEHKRLYFILTDRIMRLVSTFLPHSEQELLQIPGIGVQKVRQYGESLLHITTLFPRQTIFPLDWVHHTIDDTAFQQWKKTQQQLITDRETMAQQQRTQILTALKNGVGLDVHRELSMARRDVLALLEQMHHEGYALHALIAAELKTLPLDEHARVLALFAQEGDRYLKRILEKLSPSSLWREMHPDLAYERLRLLRMSYRNKAS